MIRAIMPNTIPAATSKIALTMLPAFLLTNNLIMIQLAMCRLLGCEFPAIIVTYST